MSGAGTALLGIGMGHGEHRASTPRRPPSSSPLLETSMDGARSILLSITGGSDLSLWEVNEAAKAVSEAAHPDANIIFGAMVDENLSDQVWVTVVATGYGERPARRPRRLDEPIGEPRIQRTGAPRRPPGARRCRSPSLDVPEFVPRVLAAVCGSAGADVGMLRACRRAARRPPVAKRRRAARRDRRRVALAALRRARRRACSACSAAARSRAPTSRSCRAATAPSRATAARTSCPTRCC